MVKRLGNAIDLIGGLALREGQQFRLKLPEEPRLCWKEHEAGCKLAGAHIEPSRLIVMHRYRFDSEGQDWAKLLSQRHAR
jgi:hypothetical protein